MKATIARLERLRTKHRGQIIDQQLRIDELTAALEKAHTLAECATTWWNDPHYYSRVRPLAQETLMITRKVLVYPR